MGIKNSSDKFLDLRKKYSNIYVIISPPRGSSTALARTFWEQLTVRYYSHEPFEIVYYLNRPLKNVIEKIKNPLNLTEIKTYRKKRGNGLIIKEMPYQVGKYFPLLASIATKPIVFLIRDPRLTIYSRMEKKREVGENPVFPLIESGWELIFSQIDYCTKNKIPYIVMDSTDFRNNPENILPKMFNKFNLPFSKDMLSWKPAKGIDLDNLAGRHTHLYRRVLLSTRIQSAQEQIPSLNSFPARNGFRKHVKECIKIYNELLNNPKRILIT